VFAAEEVKLHQITFPERKTIDVEFARTGKAPMAELEAKVKHEEGAAQIEVKFRNMKPAILFGGDITSYVLWAVVRDGTWENLGELWVREDREKLEFTTRLKNFALMVTAEPYPLVSQPSELVMFTSNPSEHKRAVDEAFYFSDFAPAAAATQSSIAAITWDGDESMDLKQAKKAVEYAERMGAKDYTPRIYREAHLAMSQANAFTTVTSRKKEIVDFSRRAVSLASEAISTTLRRKEREEIERQIAERKREMEALEKRASDAESMATTAKLQLLDAQSALAEAKTQQAEADAAILTAQQELTTMQAAKLELEAAKTTLETEKATLESERTTLLNEKTTLEADKVALVADKTSLETEKAALLAQQASLQASVAELDERAKRLQEEREQLSSRLESALSHVADVNASARGMIVSLPDILFDLNEATLKNQAKVVISKLSGILLVMPNLNLRIEGHTDSSGSDEHNQRLSERRAGSVKDFLAAQGIDMNRMVAVGYGENRPVADNESNEGRKKNRRVEIVIAEGEIKEASF
jgi:outer membrane protein OmpA-like peptidoglycan-associated protein